MQFEVGFWPPFYLCDNNWTVPFRRFNDSFCDCPQCEDEPLWSCSDCECPTQCGSSPDCFAAVFNDRFSEECRVRGGPIIYLGLSQTVDTDPEAPFRTCGRFAGCLHVVSTPSCHRLGCDTFPTSKTRTYIQNLVCCVLLSKSLVTSVDPSEVAYGASPTWGFTNRGKEWIDLRAKAIFNIHLCQASKRCGQAGWDLSGGVCSWHVAQVMVGHYQCSIGRTTTATALTVRMRRTGLAALAAAQRIASTAFHARARSRTTRRATLLLRGFRMH